IAHHDCYILLHSSQSPTAFPKVFNTPLSIELQRRASKWGGLVNFSWFGEQTASSPDTQSATVFSHRGGRLEIPEVSLENLDRVERTIQSHLDGPLTDLTAQDVYIYVCTHRARDCRCGERGGRVLQALREAVRLELKRDPCGPADRIKVGEVGHVGGHKFAANLLVFPLGEWLGVVKPDDSTMIIKWLCEELYRGIKPFGISKEPPFLSHWRGRMGLTKEEQ
ncbi:hypothetical protein M413DRAFT_36842, partial [Hebeloma cylindrosporum]